MSDKTRSFRIVHFVCHSPKKSTKHVMLTGRFTGIPVAAAKKAARKLCKEMNMKNKPCIMEVHVQETTRGSKNKVFAYLVEREIHESPVEIVRDGLSIMHHFKMNAKSIPMKMK